jgi:hypothetical protein
MIKDLSKTTKVTVIPGYGMIFDKKEENEGRLVTTAGTPHEQEEIGRGQEGLVTTTPAYRAPASPGVHGTAAT